MHAVPSSGVIGARPLGVPGLRYPGAACDKRMRAEVESQAAILLVDKWKLLDAAEVVRVFRKRPAYAEAFRQMLARGRG